ncbi:hypothetical protein RintRC_7730 [Richelia intracellularis]|nr:hypothetical protein RintRC_7730 [Richelia intracellularis]
MYIIVKDVLIINCQRQRPLGGTGGASPKTIDATGEDS